jgi:hypothetical protein
LAESNLAAVCFIGGCVASVTHFHPANYLQKTTEAAGPGTDIQYPACDNRDGADNLAADDTNHYYILLMWSCMLTSNKYN